jgi:hypothetical protein
MNIDKVIDLGFAKVVIKGELEGEELDFIVEAGLRAAILEGAMPEVMKALEEAAKDEEKLMGYDVHEGSDTVQ